MTSNLHSSAAQTVVKAAYWFSESEFPVSSINSTLFTHLFCAFADLNPTTYQVTISSTNEAQFSSFTDTVRQNNPSIKTLLSIGGGNDQIGKNFAAMASQATQRQSFIDSSIKLARNNNFDGLDVDWEYPLTSTDFANFGTLLTEWRSAVASEASSSGKAVLLLTAAVFRSSNYYSFHYPVQEIKNSLDWINVMTYDFYGPGWSPESTYPPAALHKTMESQVNADEGIRAWIEADMNAKKIVLGLPFYGYAWKLKNANNHDLRAQADGPAISKNGDLVYNKIMSFISQNNASTVFDDRVGTNYCYSGTTWIAYDDTKIVAAKVSYAKEKELLGYFAWHVGADDDNWALSQTAWRAWEA